MLLGMRMLHEFGYELAAERGEVVGFAVTLAKSWMPFEEAARWFEARSRPAR